MNIDINDVIIKPLMTEKSLRELETCNKYFFKVNPQANKYQIKDAIEKLFNVKPKKVAVINMVGKKKRVRYKPGYTANWKKAIVTLKQGEKIEGLYEGVN